MPIERLQAPSAGLNSDASPDYVGLTQAADFANLIPGLPGRVVSRGPFTQTIVNISAGFTSPTAAWAFDDVALLRLADGTTQQIDLGAITVANVTGTILQVPASSAHARLVDAVYGAITNAANPALGKWSGGTITVMTNAPYQFKDVQAYAQRLWTLSGSVPGTTTPVNKYTLYYTNPAAAGTDLSLLATWKDVASGLVNQLNYVADDTPVGLASCGRFMAILGTQSINIVTGSGSSNFAVRNLTRNWGVLNLESIVEVDDGFYFMSTRGFCFCDGSSVRVVSDGGVTSRLTLAAATRSISAAPFFGGYVAVGGENLVGNFLLYHPASQAWVDISSGVVAASPAAVLRTSGYPFIWAGRSVHRCEQLTQPFVPFPIDPNLVAVPATWRSRVARLGSPGKTANVKRVTVDYLAVIDSASTRKPAYGWIVSVLKEGATQVAFDLLPTVVGGTHDRQRYSFDINGEFETLQLLITQYVVGSGIADPTMNALALFDAWVEYDVARDQKSF